MQSIVFEGFCGEGLHFYYSGPAIVLAILSCLPTIRVLFVKDQKVATQLTTIGVLITSIGVYGATDLFTSYICFEIAGFLSIIWVLQENRKNDNAETGRIYLGWLVITGMIMTMGMFLFSHFAGTLEYEELMTLGLIKKNLIWANAAAVCYLIGAGTRCGMVFFHAWMDTIITRMPILYRRLVICLLVPGGIWQLIRLYPILYDNRDWQILLCVLAVLTVLLYIMKYIWAKSGQESYLKSLQWASMERLLYRPLFCSALPFFFGVIFRILDYLPDGIVALLRGSIYRDSKQRVWDKVGTQFTYIWGVIFDEFAHILNCTILRRRPITKSFVNGFAVAKKELEATTGMITKSVSFGLLMFCVGMCITLVYLFF
jgi:hypothetical protein